MRLDLRDIIPVPGARKDFQETLDLGQMTFYGERPFQNPVQISGSVRNMAGALELAGEASTTLATRCSRCLKPLLIPFRVPARTLLAEELANDETDQDGEEIVLLAGGCVDLDEVFTEACVLAMDGKHLCSPSCKGLCPRCGKDLNEGPCGCGKELDPRLAVLARLLDRDGEPSDEIV